MLYEKYKPVIDQAVKACQERRFFAQFPEHPKAYGDEAPVRGEELFRKQLGHPFKLLQGAATSHYGEEISPYTLENLGITYPFFPVDDLIANAKGTQDTWSQTSVEERSAVLVESLEKMKDLFFLIAHATMHTTGQSFMMSFQASGPHAADRALEAVAMGYHELTVFPERINWEKPVGKSLIRLEKTFIPLPKGISLVVGCSTFPVWNTLPGLYASLVTGNPVIVKPHPGAVFPIAIVIRCIQDTLRENGYDPCLCQLAADSSDHLITKTLCEHPAVKLIDYTGSTGFGNYIESLTGKTVFTEKAGVNAVILDSVKDMGAVMQNLAFSVSLYSGQMCTAPQNFFIPLSIRTSSGEKISFEEVSRQFKEAVQALLNNPKMGPGTLGAIQNANTQKRAMEAGRLGSKIVLDPVPMQNPEYPQARTCTPVILEADAKDPSVFEKELFGPVVLLIKTRDTSESLRLARDMALRQGAITCSAYSTDCSTMELIAREMNKAFTPVSFNLTGPIWVNQHAAFSDFHVTGGNPAGNASFTNPEFIIKRFVWVGNRYLME